MLLTNRFSFFDKSGFNSNPVITNATQVNILQDSDVKGYGAVINAYADISGKIVHVEIISGGSSYDTGTRLSFTNITNGYVWETSPGDLTLSLSGEITSFTIPVSDSNNGFVYPSAYYFSAKFLDPVSTGLISTDHLFMLEEVFDVNGRTHYVYPRVEEYGPFNIAEYGANGTSGYVEIESFPLTGTVLTGKRNTINSVPTAQILNLKVGMFLDGVGAATGTYITGIDTVYNQVVLNQDLAIFGPVSYGAYVPHELRVGNTIRIFDTVGFTPLDGEQVITAITAKRVYFALGQTVTSTITTTAQYGVIPVYRVSFVPGSDEEFFLFSVDYNEDYPTIVKQKEFYFLLDNASTPTTPDTLPGGNALYQRTIYERPSQIALQINIGLQSDYAGVYACSLAVEDVTFQTERSIIIVQYEGETIAEDERLGSLLENFGQDVTAQQELIMRKSDVYEDLVDNVLLNQKRKEMLLEGSQIWPYVGSYRGLVNIINWFGYYDIRIKEYWLNVNQNDEYFGKYRQMQIPFQLKDKAMNSEAIALLPSRHYKKTNLFGLFYDLVRDGGTFDTNGVPETVDAFEYTNEEILIKLFALKRYLKEKFLPVNTKIVDIVGEGVYYERYTVNSWNDNNQRIEVNLTRSIDFKALEPKVQIIDDRPYEAGDALKSPPYFDPLSAYYTKYDIKRAYISNPGGLYYGTIPLVTFPGSAVQQARGIVKMKAAPIGILAPLTPSGTGYQVGDVITLAGGTYESPIRITVILTGLNGEVVNFSITAGPDQGSSYSAMPDSGFFQASVLRPNGTQYVAANATGFSCLATDIPFVAESIVLYDKGLKYSSLPSAVFAPALGGIAATLDLVSTPGTPNVYFNDGAPIEPYYDSPGIPVAATVELATSFDITWDEVPYRWQDLGGGSDATLLAWTDTLPSGLGELISVEILSPGSDYRYTPSFTVSGGGGYNATVNGSIKNGKLKILEFTVTGISSSLGTNDVLTLSPAIPATGLNTISTKRIVKGPGIPNGTIINLVNQPFSQIELLSYTGATTTTTINIGDKIYVHQGVNVVTNGNSYTSNPNVATNGGHVGTLYTWDELGRGDMYQMEWKVELTAGAEVGQVFSYRSGIRTIDELINHRVKLPYAGRYTVEMIVYDTDNNFINEIKNNYVEAYLPEATFAYAVKYISDCADTWNEFFQPPIPEFEPAPGQLAPPPVEGIRYNWENAHGRWVNPVFTDTIWDHARINWDTLEVGNLSLENNWNYPARPDISIIQVSPEDNLEGAVISYTDANTIPFTPVPRITLANQRPYPQIEPTINPNDWIYIRRDDVIYQLEVLSSSYTTPGITIVDLVTAPPEAFRNSPTTWQVLREIGGTLVVSGNQIYDPTFNPNGIAIGEYVRIKGDNNIPKRKRVPIKAKDNYTGLPNYVLLDGGGADSIYYPGGELGQIYKYRTSTSYNANLNWNSNPLLSTWVVEPSPSNDPLVNDHIGRIYILDADPAIAPFIGCQPANPTGEIRPGFTIMHMYVTDSNGVLLYEQALQTTHAYLDTSNAGHPWDIWSGTPANYGGVHVIDVVTLDGGRLSGLNSQLSSWFTAGASIWLEYEYEVFPTRTYLGSNNAGDAEIYMDFNMYPSSGPFAAALAGEFTTIDNGWFYDHGTVSGDYSLYVTNTGTWRNGLGTIVTVDDSQSELMRSSSSFLASQQDFDEDYAELHLGTLVQTWENYRPVMWDEACYHSWDTLDNQESLACNFIITGVDQNGSIQFNNDPAFLFQGIVGGMSNGEKWSQALYELRATQNPGLSRFDYQLNGLFGTDPTILNPDLENFQGFLDTYNWPDLIISPTGPGISPAPSGDTVVSPHTGPAATIANYPFAGATPVDIQMSNALPKKLDFIADTVAGSYIIDNVQGLLEKDLYVGEVLSGPGLNFNPLPPSEVLEIVVNNGHVKRIKVSQPALNTVSQGQVFVEWRSLTNPVDFLLVFQNGSPVIDAYAKTPSVDQLGWLLAQNNVFFQDPLNFVNVPICHTYPLKNIAKRFGYGPGQVGGFLGGLNEFLLVNRYYQIYQYEGINPLGLPGGWYPAADLPPQYSYLTNDPLPQPPAIDNVAQAEVDSNRLPYESAIGGTWRWEDTYVGIDPTKIPSGSVVMLTADASSIAGKTRFSWKIYDGEAILVEVIDPTLLWTFAYPGKFTVELEIRDTNGNRKSLQRKDFIEIYEHLQDHQ